MRGIGTLIDQMAEKAAEMPAGPERDEVQWMVEASRVMDRLLSGIEGGRALDDPRQLAMLDQLDALDGAEQPRRAAGRPRASEGAKERARALRAARKAKDERPI